MGNTAGVMRKGGERAKQLLIVGQRQGNGLIPFAEAYQ